MICAVVLAAGRSRRMGTQKLLLPFGGSTVVGHIVDRLLESDVGEVRVVVGHQPHRIIQALGDRKVQVVRNPDYDEGMLSSVRCGIRSPPPECRGILLALGDQPSIKTETVNQLLSAFAKTDKGILVPCRDGKRGHPLLFSTRFVPDILQHYDRTGLRGLLLRRPEEVELWNAPDDSALRDMDYPKDYKREIERYEE